MSETTTITPAIYYEILKAIKEGGNEIEMSATVTPDGTQTQTIVIRPAAPVASVQDEAQIPTKPKQVVRPSAPQCTADRCTLSSSKRGPDGLYHMGYIADRMWADQKKKWWQR